jgi:hypothetical protein
MPDRAELLVAAIVAAPIGGDARTGEWRERSVENANDLADFDAPREASQRIARFAFIRKGNAAIAQLSKDLIEKLFGIEHASAMSMT